MALSEEEICNRALLRIGQRQTIDSLDEETVQAQACKALYADTRDALLEAVPWPFATKRAALAVLANNQRSGWEYVYALPADCLAPRYIYPDKRMPAREEKIPFQLEHDPATQKTVLLTDKADAELIYTRRLETVALFPAVFVDALAWALAADLALSLAVKPQVAAAMQQKAELALRRAAAAAFMQQQPDVLPEAEHIRAR